MNDFIMVDIRPDPRLAMDSVVISPDLAAKATYGNRSVKLRVGKSEWTVKILTNPSSADKASFFLHPALLKKCFLKAGCRYGVKFDRDDIRLGPVVGIIAPRQQNRRWPFAGQTGFFEEIMLACRNLGLISFVFYFNDIDWKKKLINGYFHHNGWQRSKFPLPDVIYPRSQYWHSATARSRQRLERSGIKILNPIAIGKWEAYQVLKKNEELAPYLPETRQVNNFRQVETMLQKHQAIYLKPINGTQGKHIIRVGRSGKASGFIYQYRNNGSLYKGNAANLLQLQKRIRPLIAKRRYLIQKEIELLRYKGGIADIRAMVQKDSQGRWGVTGMAGRVGQTGAITSNICSGGSAQKVDMILGQTFLNSLKVEEIMATIATVCIKAAESIEAYRGPCGEMGIDIGVDRYGKVWFIEANLRPARLVFSLIGEKHTRLKSIENPLLYARYLAGF